MKSIKELFNDIHNHARHHGDRIIIDVIFQNGKPIVEQRPCTCILLLQALKENNMLFGEFNLPTLNSCLKSWQQCRLAW